MNRLYTFYTCLLALFFVGLLPAQTADLELDLQSAPHFYTPNEEITFIVHLAHNGGDPSNADVAFQLPDSTSLLAVSTNNGSYLPHIGRWRVSNLAAGDTATMQIRAYNFKQGGVMTVFAQVSSASSIDPDSSPNNNTSNIPNEDDEAVLEIYPSTQQATEIHLLEFPKDKQLYPRNTQTNLGTIPIRGSATNGARYTALRAKMYRNEELYQLFFTSLNYIQGTAHFQLDIPIIAELANYRLELLGLTPTGEEELISSATELVAGDVYIINGQSNAQANVAPYPSDNHAFTRSYSDEKGWTTLQFSSPGQWGARMAFRIIQEQGIPVAVFNQAVGGKRIDFYLKNEQTPQADNYGALFRRLETAGLREHVRAGFWFQGEADGWIANEDFIDTYKQQFQRIHSAWLNDYAIEQCYIFQIRYQSCSHLYPYVMEAQRSLQYELPNVSTMSTTNTAHDSCHYYYEGGYASLGDRIYNLLASDLYAASDYNVAAPDIQRAYLSGAREITLELKDIAGPIEIQGNPWSEFKIEGSNAEVIGGRLSNGRIVLGLSDEPTAATGISYYAHVGTLPNWVVNDQGVGLLTFYNYPIESLPAYSTDLELQLAANSTEYEQFHVFDYEIEVVNNSEIEATNIEIEVPLPAGTAFSRAEFSVGQYLSWEDKWNIPSLAPNSSVRLRIYVFPLVADETIVAYAQIAHADQIDLDSTPANGSATFPREDDEARLLFNPAEEEVTETDVALFLEADVSEYSIYRNVTYRLMVENRGMLTATKLQIDLSASDEFAYTSHSQTAGQYDNWNRIWRIQELEVGEMAELELVLFTLTESSLLEVCAKLASLDQIDINLSNNQTTWTISPSQDVHQGGSFLTQISMPKDAVKIYPIPSVDILKLEIVSKTAHQSKLYLNDLQGRRLKELKYHLSEGSNILSLDLSDIQTGVYFLSLQDVAGGLNSYRIVKK